MSKWQLIDNSQLVNIELMNEYETKISPNNLFICKYLANYS